MIGIILWSASRILVQVRWNYAPEIQFSWIFYEQPTETKMSMSITRWKYRSSSWHMLNLSSSWPAHNVWSKSKIKIWSFATQVLINIAFWKLPKNLFFKNEHDFYIRKRKKQINFAKPFVSILINFYSSSIFNNRNEITIASWSTLVII